MEKEKAEMAVQLQEALAAASKAAAAPENGETGASSVSKSSVNVEEGSTEDKMDTGEDDDVVPTDAVVGGEEDKDGSEVAEDDPSEVANADEHQNATKGSSSSEQPTKVPTTPEDEKKSDEGSSKDETSSVQAAVEVGVKDAEEAGGGGA